MGGNEMSGCDPKNEKLKVFISYSNQYSQLIVNIYQKLQKTGAEVKIDKKHLFAGTQKNFDDDIIRIINNCDVVIIFFSENALDLKRNFLTEFINILIIQSHKSENEFHIICVNLDNCDIPKIIDRQLYIDFSKFYEWEKLLISLYEIGIQHNYKLSIGELDSPIEYLALKILPYDFPEDPNENIDFPINEEKIIDALVDQLCMLPEIKNYYINKRKSSIVNQDKNNMERKKARILINYCFKNSLISELIKILYDLEITTNNQLPPEFLSMIKTWKNYKQKNEDEITTFNKFLLENNIFDIQPEPPIIPGSALIGHSSTSYTNLPRSHFCFWGSPESGKTSLIQSMIKHLELTKPEYQVSLIDHYGNELPNTFFEKPFPQPTNSMNDYIIKINDAQGKSYLNILHDFPGEDTLELTNNQIRVAYNHSDAIIICLPKDELLDKQNIELKQKLQELMYSQTTRNKLLFFCITKSDFKPNLDININSNLFEIFENSIGTALSRKLKNEYAEGKLFFVSAYGNKKTWSPIDTSIPLIKYHEIVETDSRSRPFRLWG